MEGADRDALITDLILHGWDPVKNSAGEHGIQQQGSDYGFLTYELLGHDRQVMALVKTNAGHSTLRACDWAEYALDELEALAKAARQ